LLPRYDDTQVLSEIRLVLKECGPAVNNEKLPNFGILHQHYIESQLLVGQLLLLSCCYCTVGSVVALAVGAGAVGCALIVTGVADDTQVLSEIRLVLKEWSRS
jgi:homoaconitase/3-isopropylmalate dehydratase large subunit